MLTWQKIIELCLVAIVLCLHHFLKRPCCLGQTNRTPKEIAGVWRHLCQVLRMHFGVYLPTAYPHVPSVEATCELTIITYIAVTITAITTPTTGGRIFTPLLASGVRGAKGIPCIGGRRRVLLHARRCPRAVPLRQEERTHRFRGKPKAHGQHSHRAQV